MVGGEIGICVAALDLLLLVFQHLQMRHRRCGCIIAEAKMGQASWTVEAAKGIASAEAQMRKWFADAT